jgi:hypothetical protein
MTLLTLLWMQGQWDEPAVVIALKIRQATTTGTNNGFDKVLLCELPVAGQFVVSRGRLLNSGLAYRSQQPL